MATLASLLDTLREQRWLRRHRSIRPGDLVLDVGSGGTPDLRANVLCDRFLEDGLERHGLPLVVDRPFVAGDAHRLPFRDGSFDYVILSHVLEHSDDPEAVLQEVQRVGRRGYIETPSPAFEKVCGFPFHRWMVGREGETLVLRPKPRGVWDPEVRDWFERMHRTLGTGERFWARRREAGVYTALEWEGRITWRIEGPERAARDWSRTEGAVCASLSGKVPPAGIRGPGDGGPLWRLQQRVSRSWRKRSDRPWPEIEKLLCCPVCRGELERNAAGGYRCAGCGGGFPRYDDRIPLLLPECRAGSGARERAGAIAG